MIKKPWTPTRDQALLAMPALLCMGLLAGAFMFSAAACRKAAGPLPEATGVDPVLAELAGFLAIPNVASDTPNIRRNADHLAGLMRKRGIDVRLLEFEGAPPVVYGEIASPGARHTLLVYAHYDGQPVDPARWASDPWMPVLRSGRLEDGAPVVPLDSLPEGPEGDEWRVYARGASDDKGTIVAFLAALDRLKAEGLPLSVNVKMLFEGEEEVSSPISSPSSGPTRSFFGPTGCCSATGPSTRHAGRRSSSAPGGSWAWR